MPTLEELLLKIARNETLSPPEMEDLRNQAKAIDEVKNAVKSWLQPGSADPSFKQLFAEGGRFTVAPLSALHLELYGDVFQAIPNNTETAILFDTVAGHPNSIRWDISEPTKIYTLQKSKRYCFIGTVQWDTNATGRRAAHINAYDSAGVLQWGQTLHSVKPEGSEPDTIAFASGLVGFTFEAAYLTMTVIQTSGLSLDLQYVGLMIFEVM